MTLRQVLDMEYDEYVGWFEFFKMRPTGWREDVRTLKLLQVQGYKGNGTDVFQSLNQMQKEDEKRVHVPGLKSGLIFQLMQNAVGSDYKLE